MKPVKYFVLKGDPTTPEKTMLKNINRITEVYIKHTLLYKKNDSQMRTILSALLASAFTEWGIYLPKHIFGKAKLTMPKHPEVCPTLKSFNVLLQMIRPKFLKESPNLFSKIHDIPTNKIWNAERLIYYATVQLEHGGISLRGFKILSKIVKNTHNKSKLPSIPQRSTDGSAGYDIRANETITVPSIPNALLNRKNVARAVKPTMVKTGLKAYMPKGEALFIYNRSSNPGKRGLYLANGVGVVDSDYYNNPSNEGEMLMAFVNLGMHDYTIHRGDRVTQGVFQDYKKTVHDKPISHKRLGGFGSTGKK